MAVDSGFRLHDLIDRQAVEHPDNDAIIIADERHCNYAQLQVAVEQAASLLVQNGVRRGDRVLIVCENCVATVAFLFAVGQCGAYAIPVNARMTASEIKRIADHATPCVTVYTVGVSPDAAGHANAASATPFQADYGSIAIASNYASTPILGSVQDTAVILYTTGTTGAPKGVMLTHDSLLFAAQASSALRKMQPSDVIYGALPLSHVFGLASVLLASIYSGSAIMLEARFQPRRVYAALQNGVTIFPGVPQMHALVMHYTEEQGYSRLENSQLRYVSSGAAPLDPVWKRKAEAFYGLPLQNGYGMTESTGGICATKNPIGTEDVSVGPPMPRVEIKLDSSASNNAELGTGEILTRGPHIMKGYFDNPEESKRSVDEAGWLHTGDLGKIDANGNLVVVGRCKELIIRGGFNVYPPEVEAALNDHPQVIQSAVIGQASESGDENILAFVQCVDPSSLDTQALLGFVGERLVSYKRPTRIFACTELPAAPTGKILKHRLLDTFANLIAQENTPT